MLGTLSLRLYQEWLCSNQFWWQIKKIQTNCDFLNTFSFSLLEGYTSISVREPLAEIIAQTKELNKKKRELDPHYSTVSDDSGIWLINFVLLTSRYRVFAEWIHQLKSIIEKEHMKMNKIVF